MKRIASMALVSVLVAVGCSHTTVFEKEDGSFSLVTNSSSESYAVSAAKDAAVDHCTKLAKKMVIVKQDTTYHGADKTAKAVIGVVNLLGKDKSYNDGSRHDDYRTSLDFKCK